MSVPGWRALIVIAAFQWSAVTVADKRGIWVIDPVRLSPGKPPIGRSLFDHLFSETVNGKLAYVIPFPFTELLERIEQQLPNASEATGGIQKVLIPMGRSLVRNASSPEFFSSPRLVIAIDSQPLFEPGHAGLLLQDRLYIGYMEHSQLLEVISYNEAAGRFEFQLVENYGPGTKPKVSYSNRQLCLACHQNAAPIFSRQQWDETNANPAIDVLLEQRGAARYGIATGAGVDIPFAIDAATDRANYYSYYQLMWQLGCLPPDEPVKTASKAGIPCRSALLRAALQFLLTDGAGFNAGAVSHQPHLKLLQANAKRHWPDGLLIADPDIPNRNPLLKHTDKVNVISEVFDPLTPRPALRKLDAGSDSALRLLVSGLAGFFAQTDRQRLDQYLFETATEKHMSERQDFTCSFQKKAWSGPGQRMGFDCRAATDMASGPVTSLQGRYTLEQDRLSQAVINHLLLADGTELRNLTLRQQSGGSESSVMQFQLFNGKRHARLPNGNAIGAFVLESPSVGLLTAPAQLSVLSDFLLLDDALSKLVQQVEEQQSDGLSFLPFRRASILPSLFNTLGMEPLVWCCSDTGAVAEANVKTRAHSDSTELKPFYQYCAVCHATASAFPANFLYGDEAQVRQRISHCAERIYYRLSMAHRAPGQRAKSPMPPQLALKAMGAQDETWAESITLKTLIAYTGRLLQKQGQNMPDIVQYEQRGFDQLRSCLPGN